MTPPKAPTIAPATLAIGAGCGLVGGGTWALIAILPTSMPGRADGAVLIAFLAGSLAHGLSAWRHGLGRAALLSGLVAAATTTGLALATAELLIRYYPGRIPDIVGPALPPGTTAARVLRENRIEILDGYVELVVLWVALALAVIVVACCRRRSVSA